MRNTQLVGKILLQTYKLPEPYKSDSMPEPPSFFELGQNLLIYLNSGSNAWFASLGVFLYARNTFSSSVSCLFALKIAPEGI